jgi:PAS domain S-box-containing protein
MNKSKQIKVLLKDIKLDVKTILNPSIKFIGLMQPDGNILEINPSALEFTRFTSSDTIGRPLWEVWWSNGSRLTQAELQTAVARAAAGECIHYVDFLGTGDRLQTLEFSIKPISNQQGKVIFLILEGHKIPHHESTTSGCECHVGGIQANSDDREKYPQQNPLLPVYRPLFSLQAEQALLESEERFRATFEQVAVGLAHVGLDGRWLRVNQKLCEILGYTREELLNLTWAEISHSDDLRIDLRNICELLAGKISTYSLEKRYIRKDGLPVWVNLTVSLLRETTKALPEPKYFIAVIEDITKRKQAEIALQQRAEELTRLNTILTQTTAMLQKRNQELDQFAYVASHDLKAPLRAIASLSQWLEEDLAGQLPPENQHQLDLLRGRVQRMEGLINGLLEYSRIGRNHTDQSLVNVGDLLQEVIDYLEAPLSFKIEVASEMPTFITKRIPLQQVFTNLIENAIKHHSLPDGSVKISVNEQGKYYKFTVADDGPGIPAEFHHKVFTIFQTLEARDRKEGTGIGLAIVKKIVETEGGTINLDSSSGVGSSFHFTWPKQSGE